MILLRQKIGLLGIFVFFSLQSQAENLERYVGLKLSETHPEIYESFIQKVDFCENSQIPLLRRVGVFSKNSQLFVSSEIGTSQKNPQTGKGEICYFESAQVKNIDNLSNKIEAQLNSRSLYGAWSRTYIQGYPLKIGWVYSKALRDWISEIRDLYFQYPDLFLLTKDTTTPYQMYSVEVVSASASEIDGDNAELKGRHIENITTKGFSTEGCLVTYKKSKRVGFGGRPRTQVKMQDPFYSEVELSADAVLSAQYVKQYLQISEDRIEYWQSMHAPKEVCTEEVAQKREFYKAHLLQVEVGQVQQGEKAAEKISAIKQKAFFLNLQDPLLNSF